MSQLELVNEENFRRRAVGESGQSAKARVRMMKPENVTCGLWLSCWPDFFPTATAKTRAQYLECCKRFAARYADLPMGDVTPLMAQKWVMQHRREAKYLRLAWRKAVLVGIAPYNPWALCEVPKYVKRDVSPPSAEQLQAAIDRSLALGADPHRPEDGPAWRGYAEIITIAAYTGARCAGLSALRLKDVDLIANRITLREKNDKVRTVALLGPAREAAARACWRSPHRRESRYRRQGNVFLKGSGEPVNRYYIGERWRKVRGEYKGPFHSLRHFAATWMLEQGASELDVAVQLGHVDSEGRPYPELIRRVYGHPDPEDALRRLEAAVGG